MDNFFSGLGFIAMVLLVGLVIFVMVVYGLPPAYPNSFYVQPTWGQYTCTLHVNKGHDVAMIAPRPMKDAEALCDQLNRDMAGNWAWGKQ